MRVIAIMDIECNGYALHRGDAFEVEGFKGLHQLSLPIAEIVVLRDVMDPTRYVHVTPAAFQVGFREIGGSLPPEPHRI